MTDASGLLAGYRLDRVLSEEDDPDLWAAAVLEHWSSWSPSVLVERGYEALFFVVGPARSLAGPSGGRGAERWVVDPDGRGGWRATNYEEWERHPDPTPGMLRLRRRWQERGVLFKVGPLPRLLLGIERPSRGLDEARVHSGAFYDAGVGSGHAAVWKKRPGASGSVVWEEGEKAPGGWRA